MTLTATKTKLYNLCARYQSLPKVKDTELTKLNRKPTWRLKFRGIDGCWHEMYFSPYAGKACLRDQWTDINGDKQDKWYHIAIDELRSLGMIND